MTTNAIIFMAMSWIAVIGLVSWSYKRLLSNPRHHDPDGIGPASPPVGGQADRGR